MTSERLQKWYINEILIGKFVLCADEHFNSDASEVKLNAALFVPRRWRQKMINTTDVYKENQTNTDESKRNVIQSLFSDTLRSLITFVCFYFLFFDLYLCILILIAFLQNLSL